MRKQIVILLTGAMLLAATSAMATQMTFGTYSYDNNGKMVLTTGVGLYNGELNPIPFDAAGFQLQGSEKGILADLRLFIGVANVDKSWLAPTISNILRYDQTSYTPSTNTATFAGYMDGTKAHTEAYGIVGLASLNNSQNWTNWSGAYSQLTGGNTASTFSIFQYNISGTNLTGGQQPVSIEFSSDLPAVTYLFGAADFVTTATIPDNGKSKKSQTSSTDNWYGTAFTETATNLPNVPVPEPGTMMLLGVGMFGLAIIGKRRMNKDS